MSVSATEGSYAAHPRQSLEMQTYVCGDLQTLSLTGELDMASVPLLEEVLGTMGDDRCAVLTLDLGNVTFVDSTGLHAMLQARELCANRGCEFRVIRPCAQVQRLFEITGLQALLFRTQTEPES